MLLDTLFWSAVGAILLIPFGWLLIKFMYGPIIAYEKIKKIFKIKDDSTIDNILSFITFLIIMGGLILVFDSGLIF